MKKARKELKQQPTDYQKLSEKWDYYSDLPNPQAYQNDYQDILSTEDCVLSALEKEKEKK